MPNVTASLDSKAKGKKSLFCLCRQIVLSAILVLMILVISTWLYLTRSANLIQIAQNKIEETLGMPVTIEHASLSLDFHLNVEGISLRFPEGAFSDTNVNTKKTAIPATFAHVKQIKIDLDFLEVVRGKVVPQYIHVDALKLKLVELPSTKNYWLPKVAMEQSEEPGPSPLISIRNSELEMGIWSENTYRSKGRIPFKINTNPTLADRHSQSLAMDIALPTLNSKTTLATGKTLSLNGSFNSMAKTGYLNFENLVFNSAILAMLPERIQNKMRQHQIKIDLRDGKLSLDGQGQWFVSARISELAAKDTGKLLKDLNLHLSDSVDWAANRDFQNIQGAIELSNHEKRITLKGMIKDKHFGTEFKTTAVIKTEADALKDLNVEIQLTNGHVSRKPTGIPEVIGKIFDDYKLFGKFNGYLNVSRTLNTAEGSPISDIYGYFDLREGTITAKQFPYQLKELTGRLEVVGGVVKIKDFVGYGGGGNRVIGNGYFSLAEPRSAKVVINAHKTLLDQYLLNILDPGVKARIDGLLGIRNLEAYNAKLDAFKSLLSDQSIKSLTPKTFQLGSQPDINITVGYTPPEQLFDAEGNRIKGKWGISFTLDLTGSKGIYEKFMYPFEIISGKVHVENNIISAHDLTYRGLTGGTGTLNGTLKPLKLSVKTAGTPIDHHLLSALPTKIARQLAPLNIKGTGDAEGMVTPEGHSFKVKIKGAEAAPFGGKYPLHHVSADIIATKNMSTIERLNATYRPIKLQDTKRSHPPTQWLLSGTFKKDKTDLNISSKSLNLADKAFDLIPENLKIKQQIANYQKKHQMRGLADLDIKIEIDQQTKKTKTDVLVKPESLQFIYKNHTQNFSDMQGAIHIKDKSVTFNDLNLKYPAGQASVRGKVDLTHQFPRYDLAFQLKNSRLSEDLNILIPEAASKLLSQIAFKGDLKSIAGQLVYRADRPSDNQVSLKGNIQNLKIQVGVPVSEMQANMALTVDSFGQFDKRLPLISMQLAAPKSVISNLNVTNLKLKLANSKEDRNTFLANEIKGQVGDAGTLSSQVKIVKGDTTQYQAQIVLSQVPLKDIAQSQKQEIAGVFSSRIAVETSSKNGQATPMTGRGGFTFEGAEITDLPIFAAVGMSMAKILNLDLQQLTQKQAVSGQSEFIIQGKDLTIQPFIMQLPSMLVKGNGQMDWDSQIIKLKLDAHPPQTRNLPPALEQITKTITNRLISLEINGPIDNPRTAFVTLGGIRRTWDSIFKGNGSKKNK